MPGVPTGPAGATGGAAPGFEMPSQVEMQQMFQTMMSQGIDPSSMDSNQFMQAMMGGGMMGQAQPPTGPQVGFTAGAGFDQGGGFDGPGRGAGGGRGRGRRGRGNW